MKEKDSDFEVIGDSDERMFGPRSFLVCGFSKQEQQRFFLVLKDSDLESVPVCFASEHEGKEPLGSLVQCRSSRGLDVDSSLERAVILSGATESELHRVMAAYRSHGLPRPLWATLTEASVTWSLFELLSELAAERAAIEG